jgi:hypothetical protein
MRLVPLPLFLVSDDFKDVLYFQPLYKGDAKGVSIFRFSPLEIWLSVIEARSREGS